MPHDEIANGITGRCYCGRVSLASKDAPSVVTYCHCSDCRRVTGAAAAAFAAFEDGTVTYEPSLKSVSSYPGVDSWFCPNCGSSLGARFDYLPGQIYVPIGVIDQANTLAPTMHCHAEFKLDWLHIEDKAQMVERLWAPRTARRQSMKPILAFDTSTSICAAALIHDGEIIGETHEALKRGQAERLFPLIEDLLQDQGLEWSGLAGLAVGIGPGNFTGIRISVSAARGLALALQVPAVGVSAFEMVMHQNAEKIADETLVVASVSAPQGSAYVQKFKSQSTNGAPHQVYADKPQTAEISKASLVIGENAQMVAEVFGCRWQQTTGLELPAVTIARIAEARLANPTYQHTPPAPLYVRAPDAAPARDKAPVILP